MRRRRAPLFAGLCTAALVVAVWSLSGCSGESREASAPGPPASASSTHPLTTLPAPGDTALAPGAEVLRFDVEGDIACVPAVAQVEVSYATRDIDAVGFVVDGTSVPTPEAPPAGATVVVPVPCDGKVHTIMLVGNGAGGPAFASKAVVTRPT